MCNNEAVPKKGQPGYDPAYKYDYLYKVLIHNVNALTKTAELDMTGDETTWGHGGFGEAGSGLTGRIQGKPGVSKGGQTVIVSDVHRIRPRAYIHRHKLYTKPAGWTAMGPYEVRLIMEKITPMVQGEESVPGVKKIYPTKPHSTWDNYFSGDGIMGWMGENGFGATMTCRRDRLPKDIKGEYLHKKKTDDSIRTKVARFHKPIVAVKGVEATEDGKKAYQRVHVSFQSTSSCNISTVNALNGCQLQVQRRERGRGEGKRLWGIEMNDARRLYLSTYSRINSIDHLVKNTRMFYRSWKYWHSPMIHGKALGVVVAYDMYLECCEGKLELGWFNPQPMDFWTFRERLSVQMLDYDPINRSYPGDRKMRQASQQHKKRRRGRPKKSSDEEEPESPIGRVTKKQFLEEKAKGHDSRLCGDITQLTKHRESLVTSKKTEAKCAVCGLACYSICKLCGVRLHDYPTSGQAKGKGCFMDWHNDLFYGLAEHDCKIVGTKKAEWRAPSKTKKKQNARLIEKIKKEAEKEGDNQPPPPPPAAAGAGAGAPRSVI